MHPINTVLLIIVFVFALIAGVTGQLVHMNPEKFKKLEKLHFYTGHATTGLFVIFIILLAILQ